MTRPAEGRGSWGVPSTALSTSCLRHARREFPQATSTICVPSLNVPCRATVGPSIMDEIGTLSPEVRDTPQFSGAAGHGKYSCRAARAVLESQLDVPICHDWYPVGRHSGRNEKLSNTAGGKVALALRRRSHGMTYKLDERFSHTFADVSSKPPTPIENRGVQCHPLRQDSMRWPTSILKACMMLQAHAV